VFRPNGWVHTVEFTVQARLTTRQLTRGCCRKTEDFFLRGSQLVAITRQRSKHRIPQCRIIDAIAADCHVTRLLAT